MLRQVISRLRNASRKNNNRSVARAAFRRRLFVESLEDRRLLAGASNPTTVLILDTTVTGGATSQEANQAVFRGMTVEVVNSVGWQAKSQADFAGADHAR